MNISGKTTNYGDIDPEKHLKILVIKHYKRSNPSTQW